MDVARDPFARQSLERESAGPGECTWCGQERRRLYTYTVSPDANPSRNSRNPWRHAHAFCNLDCYRAYNS